jgi:plasmid stabilization system protein ParE
VSGYRFHRDARDEFRSAVAWYRERSRDAALVLIDAVAEGIRSIRAAPLAWPLWPESAARRRVLRHVPYSLLYVLDEPTDEVVIIAVAHHRRAPGYWTRRKP